MKVISMRRGFATNSSSSHSIIFSANSDNIPSDLSEVGEFGWDYFVQKSKQDKLNYFYQCFGNSGLDNEDLAEAFGVPIEMIDEAEYDGYVDHESSGMINMDTAISILNDERFAILGGNDNQDDPEWTKKFTKLEGSDLYIVNNLYKDFLKSGKKRQTFSNKFGNSTVIEKGVVTTFNHNTGVKVRYSMEGSDEVYLSVPELVDIKITDYCPYGCSYCYQNSTLDGLHANYNELTAMVDKMKSEGVFELAIGGGEPTLYPRFHELIEHCVTKDENGNKIVPNFTTRNLSVFKQGAKKTKKLLSQVGGFAFSVDGKRDVKKVSTIVQYWLDKAIAEVEKPIKTHNDARRIIHNTVMYNDIATDILSKVSIQVVLGTMSREKYIETVEYFNDVIIHLSRKQKSFTDKVSTLRGKIRNSRSEQPEIYEDLPMLFVFSWKLERMAPTVMLLGYKTVGRGSQPSYDYSDNALFDISKIFNKKFSVGIDTAAAQHVKGEIERHDVPEEFYYVKEGVASCYIDAVSKEMASSSYCPEVDNNNMDEYTDESFIDNFNKYQKQGMNAIPLMAS